MNFSNVSRLVIPEGEVAVISRGSDVLWNKPGMYDLVTGRLFTSLGSEEFLCEEV